MSRFAFARRVQRLDHRSRHGWGGAPHLEGQTQNLKVTDSWSDIRGRRRSWQRRSCILGGGARRAGIRHRALADGVVSASTGAHGNRQHRLLPLQPRECAGLPDLPRTDMVDVTFDWRACRKGHRFQQFWQWEENAAGASTMVSSAGSVVRRRKLRTTKSHENGTTLVLRPGAIGSSAMRRRLRRFAE